MALRIANSTQEEEQLGSSPSALQGLESERRLLWRQVYLLGVDESSQLTLLNLLASIEWLISCQDSAQNARDLRRQCPDSARLAIGKRL